MSEVAVALQRADRSIVVARSESSHGIKKQHAIIGAAVVFVALVSLGLAAIYSITIGDEETQQQIATQKRQSFLEDRREALALFDTTTLESIEKQLLTHEDPHLRSAHGSALIDAGMVPEALDAYAAAAKRDPRYLGFDPLIEAFKSCMTAKGCASLDARGWDLSDSNASNFREELFEIAVTGKSTQRKLATSVLEDFGGLSELATWQRDAMTLVNGTGCEERTKAIGRLADEKNDRATAILREMQERPKRGCGLLNLKDCISCLRDPLDKALAK